MTNKVNPLFIICFSRTGSTLLRYILDTHPELACPPEFHLAATALGLIQRYNILLDEADFANKDEFNAVIMRYTREHIDTMLNHYCASVNKPYWCEKSVITIDNIQFINSLYPTAQFICLYRNCLDQVGSSLEVLQKFDPTGNGYGFTPFLQKTRPNVVAGLTDYWIDKTSKMLKLEASFPKRCFRVNYESIAENQTKWLSPMFDFIGLEADESLVNKVFETRHKVGPGDTKINGTRSIHSNSVGRGKDIDKRHLDVDRIKTINKLHERLGYAKVKLKHIGSPA